MVEMRTKMNISKQSVSNYISNGGIKFNPYFKAMLVS